MKLLFCHIFVTYIGLYLPLKLMPVVKMKMCIEQIISLNIGISTLIAPTSTDTSRKPHEKYKFTDNMNVCVYLHVLNTRYLLIQTNNSGKFIGYKWIKPH